ncbi:MAG: DinB family protein [Gemmatimonadota bacterium]
MISDELRELLDHMTWADAVVWTEVLDLPSAEADPRIGQLLHHVHAVQRAYLQVIREDPVDLLDLEDFESLDALAAWGRASHEDLDDLVGDLGPGDLEREVRFPWAEHLAARFGSVHPTTVRQGLHQIVSHSTYHRGQINTRIRELDGEPPLADFVAWIWAGRPEADWPERG